MPDVFRVTPRPLSVAAACRAVRRRDCGAISIFIGTARNTHDGRRVRRLRYSAFAAMALGKFARIAADAHRRWRIASVFITHRTGVLELGEPSVIVAVSAPHRAEAFAASRFAIDRLKKIAPIWKEEFYARGGKAWIST